LTAEDSSQNEEKRRLRARFLATLRAIPAGRSREAGRAAAATLLLWPGFRAISEVACFASLPGEVDTTPVFEAAQAAGKSVCLPRMRGADLEFVPVSDLTGLVRAALGVREPDAACAARSLLPAALVLVPGLAFDRAGARLGRGAGYYDRALARIRRESPRSTFIGLGFALQIIERVPMHPHDVPVDAVLTEDALIWVDSAAGRK
jgi:5-formyltetrahydrofolate cyclo-ligase